MNTEAFGVALSSVSLPEIRTHSPARSWQFKDCMHDADEINHALHSGPAFWQLNVKLF